MADGMENAPYYTIPSLPPFLGIAPLVHDPVAGDGQVGPLGSTGTAATGALTPQPPQRIILPAGSAISSITNPTVTNASSPGAPMNRMISGGCRGGGGNSGRVLLTEGTG